MTDFKSSAPPTPGEQATPKPSSSLSTMTSSSASTTLSRPPMTPRRSLAHNPRVLGFGQDGGVMELHGLGIHTSPLASLFQRPKSQLSGAASASAPARTLFEVDLEEEGADNRFRIDEEEETLTDQGGETQRRSDQAQNQLSEIDEAERHSFSSSQRIDDVKAPIRVDSYAGLEGDQAEQGEETAILGSLNQHRTHNGNVDMDEEAAISNHHSKYGSEFVVADDQDGEGGIETNLFFEPTTAREKAWMWTSMILVLVLTLVSIAIAVDWIDWPGDGIGKD